MSGADERLSDWLDGRLSPAEQQAFERELAADPDLARRAASYRALGAALREGHDELPGSFAAEARRRFESARVPRSWRVLSWETLGLAAAALVAAALFLPMAWRESPPAGLADAQAPAAAPEPSPQFADRGAEDSAGARRDHIAPPPSSELRQNATAVAPASPTVPGSGAAPGADLQRGPIRAAPSTAAATRNEPPSRQDATGEGDEGFAPAPAPARPAPPQPLTPERIARAEALSKSQGASAPREVDARETAAEAPPPGSERDEEAQAAEPEQERLLDLRAGSASRASDDAAAGQLRVAPLPAGVASAGALRVLGAAEATARLGRPTLDALALRPGSDRVVLIGPRPGLDDCARLLVADMGDRYLVQFPHVWGESAAAPDGCALVLPDDGRPVEAADVPAEPR